MRKIDIDEVKRRLKVRFPDEDFTIIKYTSLGQPGTIQCNNCKKIIEINKVSNFFAPSKKYGCSECRSDILIQRKRKMQAVLKKYDIVETYIKETHTYYKVKCKECGHIRDTSLNNLYRHLDCGCVSNVKRNRSPQEFIEEINAHSLNGTYDLVGEYKNQTTPVLLRHSCGFIWKVRPSDIIHGRSGCPKCRWQRSKGELLISQILKDLNVDFEEEKYLDNSKQRFDFYLENEKMKIAIEYNGLQHYKETNFFVGDLQTFQERDKRKSEYCKNHNIKLFVIPYTMTRNEIVSYIQKIIEEFND